MRESLFKEEFALESMFLFCRHFAFSSWAARIPDIKAKFSTFRRALGTLLLYFYQIGSVYGLPIAGGPFLDW